MCADAFCTVVSMKTTINTHEHSLNKHATKRHGRYTASHPCRVHLYSVIPYVLQNLPKGKSSQPSHIRFRNGTLLTESANSQILFNAPSSESLMTRPLPSSFIATNKPSFCKPKSCSCKYAEPLLTKGLSLSCGVRGTE